MFVQNLPGGIVWKFTGYLASTEFRRALGMVSKDATEGSATPGSTKQKKAAKKQRKQEKRHQKRSQKTPSITQDDAQPVQDEPVDQGQESPLQPQHQGQESPLQPQHQASQSEHSTEYTIERLLGAQVEDETTQYLVKWDGFDEEQATWEPASNIPPTSIEEYYRNQYPGQHRTRGGKGKAGGKRKR